MRPSTSTPLGADAGGYREGEELDIWVAVLQTIPDGPHGVARARLPRLDQVAYFQVAAEVLLCRRKVLARCLRYTVSRGVGLQQYR